MPELDRFERSFRPGWINPYRLARSATASEKELSDSLVTSLCRSLRELDGVPGFESLAGVLRPAGARPQSTQFAAIEEIVRRHEGHRHTQIAAGVAKSMLIRQAAGDGLGSARSIVEQFATRTCRSILGNYFFAIARGNLIEEGVRANDADAHIWQARVFDLLHPRMEQIADKLIDNPDARGLRAPDRTVGRESTEDLLNDNLLSQEPNPVAPSRVEGSP